MNVIIRPGEEYDDYLFGNTLTETEKKGKFIFADFIMDEKRMHN